MKLTNLISGYTNYAATKTSELADKIANNPSAAKKFLQVISKSFAAHDLYFYGKILDRDIIHVMKDTRGILDFYGTFEDVMFWINPFSKETLDDEALLQSLNLTFCAPIKNKKSQQKVKGEINAVYNEIMAKEAYYSKGEVQEALKASLQKHGYESAYIEKIADQITIQQKSRPITLLFCKLAFTPVGIVENMLTLEKWGLVDLGVISEKIGSTPVFAIFVDIGLKKTLGSVVTTALLMATGESSYRLIVNGKKYYYSTNNAESTEAYKDLREAFLDTASRGSELALAGTTLFFTLTPQVFVGFALATKGIGLYCALQK